MDGYRALVLQHDWYKAYYRCADAWTKLGDMEKALAINESGRRACAERVDLDRQFKEIQAAKAEQR